MGSGALPDLMVDLGSFKISLGGVLIPAPAGCSNPAGPYPNHFPNPAGQS